MAVGKLVKRQKRDEGKGASGRRVLESSCEVEDMACALFSYI